MTDSRKVVLITGCSPGGIGNALAREFHAQGMRVLATGRMTETIQDLADIGIETLSLEVNQLKSVNACKEAVKERTKGGLDYLVNNAGRNYTVPAIETDFSEMEAVFATNLFAVVRMNQAFMPLLRQSHGTIIQIGSVAACFPFPWSSIYNASKAALHSYSATLRVEVAPLGVHVITVITGGVKSRITRFKRDLQEGSAYEELADDYSKRQGFSQTGAMDTQVYAKEVVQRVLAAEGWLWRTKSIWVGGKVGRVRWLSWLLPETVITWMVSRMFGFNKVLGGEDYNVRA